MFNFQQFILTTSSTHLEEKSNIVDITDDPADSKETVLKVLTSLEKKSREIRGWSKYLVVVGDGKTYQHLMELKSANGNELSSLLPFPGDWHILKNFQPVLFKAYYDAGLKDIAQNSGFKATTLTSLSQCSNWRITHNFIMQLSEAIYRCMLSAFMHHHHEVNPAFISKP